MNQIKMMQHIGMCINAPRLFTVGTKRGIWNRMLEQFSSYSGVDEARIVDRVTNNDPKLRLIITTITLGMGIDMPGVENIYHWGCPDMVRY